MTVGILLDRLREFRSKRGVRDALFVVGAVVSILLGLELFYVMLANVVLNTSLITRAVASARGITLEYESARSYVPGRVSVRGLRLRFEDYNVQFLLALGGARVDVSLHELFSRKFHVLALSANDVRFYMRHKVVSVERNEARLEAYPRIAGFSDPPLYRGPHPPPISDSEYDLWEVHVENVIAQVRELWILEYRFEGVGEASGSFLLRPARWLEVAPGQLVIRSGTLHAKPHVVAKLVTGSLRCSVPGLDVKNASGMKPFAAIDAAIDLSLRDGTLGALNLYTEPRAHLSLGGPMQADVRARLSRGKVSPDTRIRVFSSAYTAELGPFDILGEFEGVIERRGAENPVVMRADLTKSRVRASFTRAPGPEVPRLKGNINLGQVDVTEPVQPEEASFTMTGTVPALAWFDGFLSEPGNSHFSGSGAGQLQFERKADGKGSGQLEVQIDQGKFDAKDVHLRAAGRAVARFRTEERPRPFVQGALSVRLTGADSLLSLATGKAMQDLLASSFDLDELAATVAFHTSATGTDLELTEAQSGDVSARGFFRRPAQGKALGAVQLSTGLIRLGVTFDGEDTDVTPLVAENWLERARRR